MSDVAATVVTARTGDVCRGDALTCSVGVRRNEDIGTWLGVGGLLTLVADGGDCDCEAAVSVSIVVRIVV